MTVTPPDDSEPPTPRRRSPLTRLFLALYFGLFVATSIMWSAGGRWVRHILSSDERPAPGWRVLMSSSAICFRKWQAPIPTLQSSDPFVRGASRQSSGMSSSGGDAAFGLLGRYQGQIYSAGTAYPYHEYHLPYYTLFWATLPAALLVGRAFLRRRRDRLAARAGLCPTCGYDLRASPLRCPECGGISPPRPGRGLKAASAHLAETRSALDEPSP